MIGTRDITSFILVVISMVKFFNIEEFADGFHKYEPLAKCLRAYPVVFTL